MKNNTLPKAIRKRHVVTTVCLLAAVIALVLLLSKGLTFDQTKIPSELVGKPAYPFSASWIQGREFVTASGARMSLEDFKGQPVILNFWASWCVSCRQEALELEAFWKKHQGAKIAVVGIAIQDTVDDAKKFAQHFGKTYILGLDDSGKISIDYGVTGVPETFIIDRTGKVVHKEVGPVTREILEGFLPELGIGS